MQAVDKRQICKYNFPKGGNAVKNGFFEKVYQVVKQIPKGKVATYGQIARLCGNAKMARQVGWALHVNPQPFVIPCHRVVTKQGQLAPAFAFGGEDAQRRALESEGICFVDGLVDMQKHLWER
ncbi:MAG: MGMT family protein [Clostridia bacterium]|nr:MGMT family protein [Clostridia bacterium]